MNMCAVSVSLIPNTRALVEQDLSLYVSFIGTDSSICSSSTPSITINCLCISICVRFCARGSGKSECYMYHEGPKIIMFPLGFIPL